jgi:hypothetical protein
MTVLYPLHIALYLAMLAPANAIAADAPMALRCKAVSNIACGADSICIADTVRDDNPVTFNFRLKRFSSRWGAGRITEDRDTGDGRHHIYVSAPPASGEFFFTQDWRVGSAGGSVSYACERLP